MCTKKFAISGGKKFAWAKPPHASVAHLDVLYFNLCDCRRAAF